MKRFLQLLFAVLTSIVVIALPVMAADASSGTEVPEEAQVLDKNDIPVTYAVITVESHMGQLDLILPEGVGMNALVLDGDRLRNFTSGTLYVHCPQFPDYTFSASRYGVLTYREQGVGTMQSVELVVHSVKASPRFEEVFPFIVIILLMLGGFARLWDFGRRC